MIFFPSCSVTIVTAYMMKKHGMSVSQALEHVKSRRENASPNHGFMLQLQNFEKSLQGTSSSVPQLLFFILFDLPLLMILIL